MPPRRQRMTRAEVILRFIGSSLLTAAVFAMFCVSVVGAWHMYGRLSLASKEAEAAQRQLASLAVQKEQVDGSVANLQSARGIEAALRERYGVAKPGEGVIQIVQQNNETEASTTLSSQNIFVRIFRTLFVW